jgi:hypothetical protein
MRPIPTKKICDMYDQLKRDVLTILSAKKYVVPQHRNKVIQKNKNREKTIQQHLGKQPKTNDHGNNGLLFRDRVSAKNTRAPKMIEIGAGSGGGGSSSSSSSSSNNHTAKETKAAKAAAKKKEKAKKTTAEKKAAAALRKAAKLEKVAKVAAAAAANAVAKARVAAAAVAAVAKADKIVSAKGATKKRNASELSGGDIGNASKRSKVSEFE